MTTATQTIDQARALKTALATKGHDISLKDAYQLARASQHINASVARTLAERAREDRVRAGDVARAIQAGLCVD